MSQVTNEMAALLPFQYEKSKTGNLYKILDLFGTQLEKISNSSRLMAQYKDIGQAMGKTLDRIGEEYGLIRTTQDDEMYRFMIKAQISINQRTATVNEIIQTFSTTSGLPVGAFDVQYGTEPLSVVVKNIPATLAPSEALHELVFAWVKSILPAGIKLEGIYFREANQSELSIEAVIEQSAWFKTPISNMNVPGTQKGNKWQN